MRLTLLATLACLAALSVRAQMTVRLTAPLVFQSAICETMGGGDCTAAASYCAGNFTEDARSSLRCDFCIVNATCKASSGSVVVEFVMVREVIDPNTIPRTELQLLNALTTHMANNTSTIRKGRLGEVVKQVTVTHTVPIQPTAPPVVTTTTTTFAGTVVRLNAKVNMTVREYPFVVCKYLGLGDCAEGLVNCAEHFRQDGNRDLGCTDCVRNVTCQAAEPEVSISFALIPTATQTPQQLLQALRGKFLTDSKLNRGFLVHFHFFDKVIDIVSIETAPPPTSAPVTTTTTAAAAAMVEQVNVGITSPLNFTEAVCLAMGSGDCAVGAKKCAGSFMQDASASVGCTGCISGTTCSAGSVKISFTITAAPNNTGSTAAATPTQVTSHTVLRPWAENACHPQLLARLEEQMKDAGSPLQQGALGEVIRRANHLTSIATVYVPVPSTGADNCCTATRANTTTSGGRAAAIAELSFLTVSLLLAALASID